MTDDNKDGPAQRYEPSLAKRSVHSVGWSLGASGIRLVAQFVRSVLLARLLPIEVFGVYALAATVAELTMVPAKFGTDAAFLHRAPETEDERAAAATHLTINLVLLGIWVVLLTVGAQLFTDGGLKTALVAIVALRALAHLSDTPRVILTRRIVHRRLSGITVVSAVVSTIVAGGMALAGAELWALLAIEAVDAAVRLGGLYGFRPVWRPHLRWVRREVAYFLDFGRRHMVGSVLNRMLYRLDDLWVGTALGDLSLGLYSRAYAFARYPSLILAGPIYNVVGGTFATLKGDRDRLSRAYFTTTAFLIRAGFLIAGLLLIAAPEFIRLVIGARWLPMMETFRLMLAYALLNPINGLAGQLLTAVGCPEVTARVRGIQLLALVGGMMALGTTWGIDGVALAVDLMALTGLLLLLSAVREHVDFSIVRLFGLPLIALGAAAGCSLALANAAFVPQDALPVLLVKCMAFGTAYSVILGAFEGRRLYDILRTVFPSLRGAADA